MIGLILVVLSLILYYFTPAELLPALDPYRPQVMILVPGIAVSLVSLAMRPRGIHKPQFLLMLGFWFAICMSSLSKLWLRGTLQNFIAFAPVVCLYFMVAVNATSTARIRTVCIVLSLCGVVMSLMGIMAYYTDFMKEQLLMTRFEEGLELVRRVRATGVLGDPNDFSQFLVVGIGMLGVLWKKGYALRNLLVLAPPVAVMVFAIYLSGSRGAIFGLAVLVFVAISTRLGPLQSMALAAVMFLVMMAANFGGGRHITLQEERVMIWGTGISMLKTHPLFGVGYNQFTEHSDLTAHNSFVLCFAELGLFGYFFWLGLILVSVLNLRRLAKLKVEDEEQAKVARLVYPLTAAMYSFLATGWFLSRTYNATLFIHVALVGALTQVRKEADPNLEAAPPRWIPVTIGLQFASVILIWLTIRARAI